MEDALELEKMQRQLDEDSDLGYKINFSWRDSVVYDSESVEDTDTEADITPEEEALGSYR